MAVSCPLKSTFHFQGVLACLFTGLVYQRGWQQSHSLWIRRKIMLETMCHQAVA